MRSICGVHLAVLSYTMFNAQVTLSGSHCFIEICCSWQPWIYLETTVFKHLCSCFFDAARIERCLLYSLRFWGENPANLLVAAGTIFNEVRKCFCSFAECLYSLMIPSIKYGTDSCVGLGCTTARCIAQKWEPNFERKLFGGD